MDAKINTKKVRSKINYGEIGIQLLYGFAAAAVSLAQLPFGASPLGFALICAAPRRRVLAAALGAAVAALFSQQPAAMLICLALTLALRALLSLLSLKREEGGSPWKRVFEEHPSLRAVSAAAGGFSLGLYSLYTHGFLYYYLFGAIVSILAAALACALWSALESNSLRPAAAQLRTVGFMSLCAGAVYGLRGISVYGITLSVLACSLLSLSLTRKKGVLYGAFLALITGLAVSFTYAPLFVFAAVCYGFISSVSPFLGVASAFAVGMAWGVYTQGIGAVTYLLGALLLSNTVFLTVDRLYLTPSAKATPRQEAADSPSAEDSSARLTVALARLDDTAGKIKLLCEGFASLSDMLLGLDDSPPSLGGIGEYAKRVGDGLAVEIGELSQCFEGDIPTELYEGLLADEQRTRALALDYRAISDYLAGIMVEDQKEYEPCRELSERINAELDKCFGKGKVNATALGENSLRVLVTSKSKELLTHGLPKLRQTIGLVCGFSLKEGELGETNGEFSLTLRRVAILEAVCAGRRRSSEGEGDFCGDSFGAVLKEDSGSLFAYISDGMGSGREAAVTAELCTAFLGKLLPVNMNAGGSVEPTLEMLNGLIRGRNGSGMRECAATVDLAAFDLIGCRACFYKSGAAPSYVFRDGDLFKIKARTVPVGIVKEPDIGRITMELLPGDTVVMVSDGVTEGREECPELFDLLQSRLLTHSPDQLADAVMEYTKQRACSDDASVLVVKIKARGTRGDAKDAGMR